MLRSIRLAEVLAMAVLLAAAAVLAARPNVLFIAVDDLRPLRDPEGRKPMITPNLDRISAQGVRFDRQFVLAPTCGASRYTLLTGRREAVTSNESIRDRMHALPSPESMPHHFRLNGYRTVAIGKIGHYPDGLVYKYDGSGDGRLEMPRSWDETGLPYGAWKYGWGSFFGYAGGKSREGPDQLSPEPLAEHADVPDTGYPDGLIAEAAVRKLKQLKDSAFFLAVGFSKPHLPFAAPKKYWDLYERGGIRLPAYAEAPANSNSGVPTEISRYSDGGLAGEARTRYRLHGYYAGVSYVDAQIGKVIRALDSLGLDRNTIVVIWGDHGWHLGELGRWGKHTAFDWSLRSELIVRGPGVASGTAAGLVESIDIYPTLADLCGLEKPSTVAGSSFRHLLRKPSLPGKSGAFGYWTGGITTLRTDRYRLVQGSKTELYDHAGDPGETENVASSRPGAVDSLQKLLKAGSPAYPYIPGCTDPAYGDYDSTAHPDAGANACGPVGLEASGAVSRGRARVLASLDPDGGLRVRSPYHGRYLLTVSGIRGETVVERAAEGDALLPREGFRSGLHLVTVRQAGSVRRGLVLFR